MPKIVTRQEWLEARKSLLAREKQLTRERDAVSAARRELPWVLVEDDYQFQTEAGPRSLAELFDGHRQLLVYHFMFDPAWDAGCKSCSFWADNYDGTTAHLSARDIKLTVVSRAPLAKLLAYRQRMGWSFDWVSSEASRFNYDYRVSFTPEELAAESLDYNYAQTRFPTSEAPGISVFITGDDGRVYHTYSCYARGIDMLNASYHHMDLTPLGRAEQGLGYSMSWLRRHDEYVSVGE